MSWCLLPVIGTIKELHYKSWNQSLWNVEWYVWPGVNCTCQWYLRGRVRADVLEIAFLGQDSGAEQDVAFTKGIPVSDKISSRSWKPAPTQMDNTGVCLDAGRQQQVRYCGGWGRRGFEHQPGALGFGCSRRAEIDALFLGRMSSAGNGSICFTISCPALWHVSSTSYPGNVQLKQQGCFWSFSWNVTKFCCVKGT